MNTSWKARFAGQAFLVASWSKDPSTKVGCVIVNEDCQVLASGFNGFPRGVEDEDARLQHRDSKLRFTVHAEANAVAQAARTGVSLRNARAFVTHRPCSQCAALLVQAGIKRVWFCEELSGKWDDGEIAATIFRESGVDVGILTSVDPFKAAYKAGWNDREGDLLAATTRTYGDPNRDPL